jgi:type IV pilus assembly protein PilQ
LFSGCIAPKPPDQLPPAPPPPDAPEVAAATQLFEQGHVQDAIAAAIDITRKNPGARGLPALQARLARHLAEERAAEAEARAASTVKASSADATRFGAMPETYRTLRHVVGETGSLRTVSTEMQKALRSPVSVNLTDAGINAFIAQFAQSTNINIVADSALNASEAKITVKAENTPLIEILDYVGRNLGVTFSVGESIIWATPRDDSETAIPMETRVYKLRKGLIGTELGKSIQGLTPFKGAQSSRDSGRDTTQQQEKTEKPEGKIGLLDAIPRFVPQPEGAELLFNDKSHVLIVKNTKENLNKTEELIDALDIRPLQVLIEARFITTQVSDLKDLGIDWLLDNRGPAKFAGSLTATEESSGSTADSWWRGNQAAEGGRVRPDVLIAQAGSQGGKLAYQAVLGDTALQATLHALQQDGQSRAIFVPRVTTLNNHEATVRIGEDTTYYDDVDAQSTTSTGYGNASGYHDVEMNYNPPSRLETGCSLIVTPSVGADLSTINLLLRPEISEVIKWEEYIISTTTYQNQQGQTVQPTIKIPTVSRQYIETETVVRSGETVVLGGLVRTQKQEDTTATPWLSDLPLIGKLFKVERKEDKVDNILIFVTATLISDTGEGLIPLNDLERYGVAVPAANRTPLILREGAPLSPPDAIPNAPNTGLPPPVSQSTAPAPEAPPPAETPAPQPAAGEPPAPPAAPAPNP